jgi:hypothetical protein
MFRKATLFLTLVMLGLRAAPAAQPPVPATSLIPDDVVLVLRVTEPKALIDRAFDQRVVQFVQSLPPYQQAMAKDETKQAVTMLNFFLTKYEVDLPALLERLFGGGVTLALGPNDAALLIVDGQDEKMVAEIHDFFRTIAKTEAAKQGSPQRVASADYRGVTGWTFAPGESHAIIGSRLLVANKPEALKAAIDRQLDRTGKDLTQSSRYQTAVGALGGTPHLTLYADMGVLKQLPGFQQGLTKNDNPLSRLLLAPFLGALTEATWLAAGLEISADNVTAHVVTDRATSAPNKLDSFARPQDPQGGAMPQVSVPGQIAGLSLYRDLHQFYAAKDELFPDRTSGLIFFENMMGIFFSGKDLTNEVLAQTMPDMRVVVAEQRFDAQSGTPAMKLPGFAVILQLRDPAKFELMAKEAWQKAIGLVNFTRGQQALPGLIIDSATHNGTTYTTSFFSVADEENKEAADIRFNFRPALAIAGDRLIMSSSDPLTRDLIDAVKQQRDQGVAPLAGRHSLFQITSGPLASILASNREALIRQNMVEHGRTHEEAEQEIGGLFLALKHVTSLEFDAGTRDDRSDLSVKFTYDLSQ